MVVSLRLCCTRFSCAAQELPFNKKTVSNVIECQGSGGGGHGYHSLVYLPCEQWFLWARRYAMQGEKRSVASGLEKPLLAG